jgi:hypothetical protein
MFEQKGIVGNVWLSDQLLVDNQTETNERWYLEEVKHSHVSFNNLYF